jgi:hypothetical protein
MLPIEQNGLCSRRLSGVMLPELTLKVRHVSLGVGQRSHIVRRPSEVGGAFVALERFAQPDISPILPGLIDDRFTTFGHASSFAAERRPTSS